MRPPSGHAVISRSHLPANVPVTADTAASSPPVLRRRRSRESHTAANSTAPFPRELSRILAPFAGDVPRCPALSGDRRLVEEQCSRKPCDTFEPPPRNEPCCNNAKHFALKRSRDNPRRPCSRPGHFALFTNASSRSKLPNSACLRTGPANSSASTPSQQTGMNSTLSSRELATCDCSCRPAVEHPDPRSRARLPPSAHPRTMAAPIPFAPPVTKTTLPLICKFIRVRL